MSEHSDIEAAPETQGPNPVYKWLIVLLPSGIFLLGFLSIVYYLNGGFEEEVIRPRYEREVSARALVDRMEKQEIFGERSWETPEGRRAIRGVMTMFRSSLDERNTGYEVREDSKVSFEGELWPFYSVGIEGEKRDAPLVSVVVAADGEPSAVAALIAVGEAVVSNQSAPVELELLLVPASPDSPLAEEAAKKVEQHWAERKPELVMVLSGFQSGARTRAVGDGEVWTRANQRRIPAREEGGEEEQAAWKAFLGAEELVVLSSLGTAGGSLGDPEEVVEQIKVVEQVVRSAAGL